MKTPLLKIGLLGVLLGDAVWLGGCKHGDEATASTTAAPAATRVGVPGQRKPQGGGGVMDMNEYPAPSGVKTGVPEKR